MTKPTGVSLSNVEPVRLAQTRSFIRGTYQVVGATGRYANATGRGIVYGLERVSATPGPSGPNMITVKGTLRY